MSLNTKSTKILTVLFTGAALVSCSSAPKTFAANTEASTEISKSESALQDAIHSQVDVFAPTSFNEAKTALKDAKEDRASNAKNETMLKDVEKFNALIQSANQKSEISKTALPEVAEARLAALNVEADKNQAKKFTAADEDLKSFTADAEKGRLNKPEKVSKKLSAEYRALMVDGTLAVKLGRSSRLIAEAKNEGAKEFAPKSWNTANKFYNQAAAIVKKNPTDATTIDPAADRAEFEANKLLRVVRKTKAAGGAKAEDVVLQAEDQQQYIYKQKEALADERDQNHQIQTEANGLRGVKDLQDRVAAISNKFDGNEADVYQQDKSVIVRLKGIKFAKGKSEIPSSSYETLKKVQEAIQSFDNPKVVVEGHTDATGGNKVNQPLSQKRAESVKNYLTANLDLKNIDVEGYGSSKPITTNKTAAGRAQNRRIDVIITQSDEQTNAATK